MTKKFRILSRADRSHCDLGVTLDLRAAQSLKAALLRAVAKQRHLTLDASMVERLSSACVQLLLATGVALKAAGLSLTLQNPSETFTDSFNDLGLQPVLEQWIMEA